MGMMTLVRVVSPTLFDQIADAGARSTGRTAEDAPLTLLVC